MKVNVERTLGFNTRMMLETISIIGITIALFAAFYDARSLITALPAIYLLVERRIRKRSFAEIGFRAKQAVGDIKRNWEWILLVGVASPAVIIIASKYFMPEVIEHVMSRVPMDMKVILPTVITILIGTFLEEVIYRGFVQERLSWFTGTTFSIITSSILFALAHIAAGSFAVVAVDLAGIVFDSVLYGILYARTKNLFASWAGHLLSDLVALIILLAI